MNQGMVASVIGKFANTSAHTSYLLLVKEPNFDNRVSRLPRHKKPATLPFRLATMSIFKKLRRVLVGPPIIY